MSSSDDPADVASTAADEIDDRGWTSFIRDYGIGGVFLAFIYALINAIQNLSTSFLRPVRAFVGGLAEFISSTFLAPVRVLDAGAQATVNSFIEGASAALGPAAMPVAMISAIATLWLFLWFWNRVSFSPINFLREMRG